MSYMNQKIAERDIKSKQADKKLKEIRKEHEDRKQKEEAEDALILKNLMKQVEDNVNIGSTKTDRNNSGDICRDNGTVNHIDENNEQKEIGDSKC